MRIAKPIIEIGTDRSEPLLGANGIESNSRRISRKGRLKALSVGLLVAVPGALLREFQNSFLIERLLGHSKLMGIMLCTMIFASVPTYKALLKCLKEEQRFVRRFFVYVEYVVLMIAAVATLAFVALSWVIGDS